MEDKQLDFNKPLLSVRRCSPNETKPDSAGHAKTGNSVPQLPPLPAYKSEFKSGPVRNAGTIPFVWEKSPGRPKNEDKSQHLAAERRLVVPRLPPGRTTDARHQLTDKASERRKPDPRTDSILCSSESILPSERNEVKHDRVNDELEEARSSHSEGSSEAYEDALDTLSQSESFFLNCSVSGVSGLDGLESKPCGIFSADPKTRDLMMGRFLPAAKAMTSEVPPHFARKQASVQQRPQNVEKLANSIHSPQSFSPNRYPHHPQGYGLEDSEDEDEYNGSGNFSAKACGLFPQFLLKGSFCLLNPVPGIKVKAPKHASSVRRVRAKPYLGPCSEVKYQGTIEAPYKKGSMCGYQTGNLDKNTNQVKTEPTKISYFAGGWEHNRHIFGPQSNNRPASPSKSSYPILPEKELRETEKVAKINRVRDTEPAKKQGPNFGDLLASESDGELNSGSLVAEKTLYIDAVHKVKSPESDCSDIRENDLVIQLQLDKINNISLVDNSAPKMKPFDHKVEKSGLHSQSAVSINPSSMIDPDKSSHEEIDETICFRRDTNLVDKSTILLSPKVIDIIGHRQTEQNGNKIYKSHMERSSEEISQVLVPAPLTSTRSKVAEPRRSKLGSLSNFSSTKDESNNRSLLQFPQALPVPKSPSESWLKRTLPTVTIWNLSSPSPFGTPKSSSGDSKWETIVRTSNAQHGHLRFSEELLTPIPEVE